MSGFSKRVALGDLGDFPGVGIDDEKLPNREVVPEDIVLVVSSRICCNQRQLKRQQQELPLLLVLFDGFLRCEVDPRFSIIDRNNGAKCVNQHGLHGPTKKK